MKYTNENIVNIAEDLSTQNNSGLEKPYEWIDVVGITQSNVDKKV